MGLSRESINAISDRLIPLIAHDRVGFGFAIGTHFAEVYLNPVHLARAFLGAGLFLVSVLLERAGWMRRAAA